MVKTILGIAQFTAAEFNTTFPIGSYVYARLEDGYYRVKTTGLATFDGVEDCIWTTNGFLPLRKIAA